MGANPKMKNISSPQWDTGYYKPTESADAWKQWLTPNWQTPQADRVGVNWDPTQAYQNFQRYGGAQNTFTGAEQSAARALTNMINMPYSQAQKNVMLQGAMAPVYEQARKLKEQAANEMYARGLGQSSVLGRANREIDRSTIDAMTQLAGNIEEQAANRQLSAAQAAAQASAAMQGLGLDRTQVANKVEQMRVDVEKLNAQLEANRQALNAQLGVRARELELEAANLSQRQFANETEREIAEMKIMNQFNIDKATLDLAIETTRLENEQKNKDRTANFWANIIGGGFDFLGSIF